MQRRLYTFTLPRTPTFGLDLAQTVRFLLDSKMGTDNWTALTHHLAKLEALGRTDLGALPADAVAALRLGVDVVLGLDTDILGDPEACAEAADQYLAAQFGREDCYKHADSHPKEVEATMQTADAFVTLCGGTIERLLYTPQVPEKQ